jgi:hypothetical protein
MTGSGGGERVVAELGQDVAGLPEDLAGLGQGGVLAVLAVLDLRVIAVSGADARAWVLPASKTAQRRIAGPCRDSRPGERLESEQETVMSSPANRTALREEENRPAPASQQIIASAVTGPTPYSRAARTFAPGQVPGGGQQLVPHDLQRGLQGTGHLQGGGDLQLPGRRQVRSGRCAHRLQVAAGTQRGLAQRRGALVEEHRMDALHPGGVLAAKIVIGLQQCPALQDDRRRDPALRQPALGQQLPQVPRVSLVSHGTLRTAPWSGRHPTVPVRVEPSGEVPGTTVPPGPPVGG